VELEPCYENIQLQCRSHVIKKHSSRAGAGAMLTKTETSGTGAVAISFLQELRSPVSNNHFSIFVTVACVLPHATGAAL